MPDRERAGRKYPASVNGSGFTHSAGINPVVQGIQEGYLNLDEKKFIH